MQFKKIFILNIICLLFVLTNEGLFAKEQSLDTSLESLSIEFANLVNQKNYEQINQTIDLDEFISRTVKLISNSNIQQQSLKESIKKDLNKSPLANTLLRFINHIPESSYQAKYMGNSQSKNPIVRINLDEGGAEYIQLLTSPNDQTRWADFFLSSSGQYVSQSYANFINKKLAYSSDKSIFSNARSNSLIGQLYSHYKNLIGNEKKRMDEVNATLGRVNNFVQDEDIKSARKELNTLPAEIRNSKEIILYAIRLSEDNNDSFYEQELDRLATHYGEDPTMAFMLIDYYFYKKDWDNIHKAIELSKKLMVDDGLLNYFHSSAYYTKGDLEKSIYWAKYAINIEPNFEDPYWHLMTVYVEQEEYDKTHLILDSLVNQFGYEFGEDAYQDNLTFKKYIASGSYANWYKKYKQNL